MSSVRKASSSGSSPAKKKSPAPKPTASASASKPASVAKNEKPSVSPARSATPEAPLTSPAPSPAEQSVALFAPAALALEETRVQPLRGDASVLRKNVEFALQALHAFAPRLERELPLLPAGKLWELRELAVALEYVAGRAGAAAPVLGDDYDRNLRRLRELRKNMLAQLEILGRRGMVSSVRVAAIRKGSGDYDAARDGVEIALLFREYGERLRGLHPFPESDMDEIEQLGTWLMERITPKGARKNADPEAKKTAELRDRLHTLLVDRYVDLRRAGFYFFGEEFDQHVPRLHSHTVPSRNDEGK